MDIIKFLGRFHPLVVHLPIGILLLAALMALLSRKEKFRFLAPALDFVLLLGAISALLACVLGYLLAWDGDYQPRSLFLHQWAGILLAVSSFAVYWFRTRWKKIPGFLAAYSHWVFVALLGLVFFTGHAGGKLTHGSDYLWKYAPDPLRAIAGLGPKPVPRPPVTNLDSADIFLDVIHPVLGEKCQSCHNTDKQEGGLLLTGYEEILKGGKGGPAIVPGEPGKSELYRRITLPGDHDEFMPAEGKEGLDDDQLALIKWWIQQGAPASRLLVDMEVEKEITGRLSRMLGLSISETRLPDIEVAAADSASLQLARQEGFIIKPITPESNFLDVRLPFTGKGLDEMDIKVLLPFKDQIAWLNLSEGGVGDEHLAVVGQLRSLSRLKLANNPISDKGIAHLGDLKELTSLNLYGTSVTDQSLDALKSLQKLRSVFLWQTKVSDIGVKSLQKERPDISITLEQIELPKPEGTDSVDKAS